MGFKELKLNLNEVVVDHLARKFAKYDPAWRNIEKARELMLDYTYEEGFFFFFLKYEEGNKYEVSYNFESWEIHFYRNDECVETIYLPKDSRGLKGFLRTFDYNLVSKEVENIDLLCKYLR